MFVYFPQMCHSPKFSPIFKCTLLKIHQSKQSEWKNFHDKYRSASSQSSYMAKHEAQWKAVSLPSLWIYLFKKSMFETQIETIFLHSQWIQFFRQFQSYFHQNLISFKTLQRNSFWSETMLFWYFCSEISKCLEKKVVFFLFHLRFK